MSIRFVFLLYVILLSACTHLSSSAPTGQLHRVSRDYAAIGDATGIQPFVRGDNTLIKSRRGMPHFSQILDNQGQPVEYTEQDGYYVLNRVVDMFTVSTSGRTIRFELIPVQNKEAEPVNTQTMPVETPSEPQDKVAEAHNTKMHTPIFMLMKNQLIMQRELLNQASLNANQSAANGEFSDIKSALDYTESKMAIETAVVHTYFRYGSASFQPSTEFSDVLLPAAQEARKINLLGRTDSNVANRANARIAFARAQAVKNYLIKRGISADKIETSSMPAGDFIGLSSTRAGRAINRRVTIELMS